MRVPSVDRVVRRCTKPIKLYVTFCSFSVLLLPLCPSVLLPFSSSIIVLLFLYPFVLHSLSSVLLLSSVMSICPSSLLTFWPDNLLTFYSFVPLCYLSYLLSFCSSNFFSLCPLQCLSARPPPTPNGAAARPPPAAAATASLRPRCPLRVSCCAPTATTTSRSASTSSSSTALLGAGPCTRSTHSTSSRTSQVASRRRPVPPLCTAACRPSCCSRCPAVAPTAMWWCGPWDGGPGAARRPSAGWGRSLAGRSASPGECGRAPPTCTGQ